jgi:hypothetical protein
MEGSKPDGKKIVFTKRKRTAQDELPDFSEFTQGAVTEESKKEEDSSKLFFEGEIFDQFYRPLSVQGGIERIQAIAEIPVNPPEPPVRLGAAQREAHAAERQSIAEALAHQIYKLAQRVRETDINIYLSAFNVALAGRSCREMTNILSRMNQFFTAHYYAAIRERGERPEVYQQIVKRVGHQHSERLAKIVHGMSVEDVAKKVWDLYHSALPDKTHRIEDLLLDCTEPQLLAVREEFLLMPYKDLARQIHTLLHASPTESQTPVRKTIGKTEVYEHKKQAAYRAREQFYTIRYLLLGRSAEEIALIKRFYIDLGDQTLSDFDLSLDADIKRVFPPADVERLSTLLLGWAPHLEAEEINKIIFGSGQKGQGEDTLSDPRDAVDRDHTQGLGPFLQRFKKHRLLHQAESVHDRVLLVYELLRERIGALSPSRFHETNQALREYYGYQLDPALFPSLSVFDARHLAVTMHERLSSSFDANELVQALEYLDPRQCLSVHKAFEVVFGRGLRDLIEARAKQIGVSMTGAALKAWLDRYVDGHGRWPLNLDVLAHVRGGEPVTVWDPNFKPSSADEENAHRLAALLDQDVDQGSLDRPIREFFLGRKPESLLSLERTFFDMTDPPMPLREALEDVMSKQAYQDVMLMFAGIDPLEFLNSLHNDPIRALELRDHSASTIAYLRERYKGAYFVDLVDEVEARGDERLKNSNVSDALGVILRPEVLRVRRILGEMRRETAPEVDFLKHTFSGSAFKVMSFERAYDTFFPRLRVHLKLAAARMAISVGSFVELILALERVDTEIPARILECFDAVDVRRLQELLRENRVSQRVVEECYDLINHERTLRHALKEMAVDTDLINETLLHLQGYCSVTVAEEVKATVDSLSGDDLALEVLEILRPPSQSNPNDRIPGDINWMDEMIYQVGLAYKRLSGETLVASCRSRGVKTEALEEITARIYGLEVCSSARELFALIKSTKEGVVNPDISEGRICSHIESRGPKYRERLLGAYQSFWSHTPGYSSLLDDMTKYFKDTPVKRKLLALFLGTGSEKKPALDTPPGGFH